MFEIRKKNLDLRKISLYRKRIPSKKSLQVLVIQAKKLNIPPNLGPMVKRPDAKEDTKSFPALAATMVL